MGIIKLKFGGGHSNIVKHDFTSKIKKCSIKIDGKNNRVLISEGCSLVGVRMLLTGDNNEIIFGKDVVVNASFIQPTVINACYGTKIQIGDDSLLSNSIEIHSTDYHPIYDDKGARINNDADIVIGKHVWIGLGVKILKGSFLADDIVVGAGSIITGKYDEAGTVVAGVPAKVIKSKVSWLCHPSHHLEKIDK